MTVKERLHRLIDQHEVSEATAAKLEAIVIEEESTDPMRAWLASAVEGDAAPDEIAALDEAEDATRSSLEDVERRLGLA